MEDVAQMKYACLISNNDYSNYTPNQLIQYLAALIDLSFDLEKIEGTIKALDIIEQTDTASMTSGQKAYFFYCASNAWANKYHFERTTSPDNKSQWKWDPVDIEKEIYYLRSSINEQDFEILQDQFKCNVFTNLANAYDEVGRFIEALEYWDRALEINSKFPMALGNAGQGQVNYAQYIYDPGHQGIFIRNARIKLSSAVTLLSNIPEYSSALQTFRRILNKVENMVGKNPDHTCLEKKYSLGRSTSEKSYRGWCLHHRLFLNPLNDLGNFPIAARDIITTPDMVTSIDVGPRYQGFYNQMKQEFVSARYLCFDGIQNNSCHFSDRGVLLYDTLDYPSYCLGVEKVKIAYRVAYSLFDKIAYFLNEYLGFGKNPDKVYFRTIWYVDNKKFQPILEAKINLPLRGLYWLSKDLYTEESGYNQNVEPDARNLYMIRNHLEHKYFKLHDILIPEAEISTSKQVQDDLAFSISRHDFEKKTIRLLRLIRNALIYLSLAIRNEEKDRNEKRDPGSFIIPIISDLWDDDWKQ